MGSQDCINVGESLGQIEISSQAIAAAEALAKRVAKQGGAALIIDYGQDSIQSNSLRAIKDHNFTDPLSQPGKADLSCWVDFSALRWASLTNFRASLVLCTKSGRTFKMTRTFVWAIAQEWVGSVPFALNTSEHLSNLDFAMLSIMCRSQFYAFHARNCQMRFYLQT